MNYETNARATLCAWSLLLSSTHIFILRKTPATTNMMAASTLTVVKQL